MSRASVGVAGMALLVTSLASSEIALAATPQDVTVQLSPTAVVADGSSTSDVTGRVTDDTGAGLSGQSVSLSISSPSGASVKFTPNPATTGPNGAYTSTLTSSMTPGQYVVVATDGLATIHPAILTLLAQSMTSLTEVTATSPPVTNQEVTLVATATAIQGGLAPRGTVTFENGGVPISGCSNVPIPEQSSASLSVTCATSFAAAGSPAELWAVYSPAPDSLVTGSTSSRQTFPIAKDSVLTILGSVKSNAPVGAPVTYTARVLPRDSGPVSPSGTVQFAQDGRTIGTCGNQIVGPPSTAVCTVRYRSPGSHKIFATYLGDGSFAPSTSASATVAVRALGTISATVQWTFFHTPNYSQALTLIVNGAPLRATVRIRCRGRGCPFGTRRLVVQSARRCASTARRRCRPPAAIDLAGPLRHARLAVGAQLVVRILKPGWISKQYVFKIRRGRAPAVVIRTIAAPPLPG